MKNWIKIHKKGIIIAIIFLVMGTIIAPKGTNEVVREVVKVEYTKECRDFSIYKQIKAVDDEIILIQTSMTILLAEGNVALTQYNFDRFKEIAGLITDSTPYLEKILKQRTNLIKQLE